MNVFKAGDRVYVGNSLTGTCAEYALCEEAQVHPLPDKISFSQGAAINIPYATAYRALFHKARVQPGEVVLVHGATGGVGIAAVQMARAAGATVVGTGGTEAGRKLVLDQGAHHVLDHRAADYLKQAMELINPREAMSRDAAIFGMLVFNAPPAELAAIHQALFAGLENGTLRPVVGKELPLADAAQAHKLVMEPGAHGKIVLLP